MSCTAVSSCQTITALIECVPSIYQGTDYYFEIQLYDEEGIPLDLTEFSGIYMQLYTDGYNYAIFQWPLPTDSDSEPIIIIQNGQIDVGIIAFNITAEMSSKFLTGSLFAEIKFKKDSETTGGNPVYSTIGCLNIGNVKQSLTRDITDF